MDWLYNLIVSGSPINVYVQLFRTPFFDILFTFITSLGSAEFYLVTLPFFYWVANKSFGQRLAYLFLFSGFLNELLKNTFAIPRPFQIDESVVAVVDQEGYGLPSGHAQLATIYLGYIAAFWQPRYAWLVPTIATTVVAIMFSRIYLGVHFVLDVIVGLAIGLLTLWLWLRHAEAIIRWGRQLSVGVLTAAALLLPIALLFIVPPDAFGYPAEVGATVAGTLLGTNIGIYYEMRLVQFSVDGLWGKRLLRYILGLVLVVIVWAGLRTVFGLLDAGHGVSITLRFIRYALTAITLVWWAPAAFVKLGLAEKRDA